MKHKEFILALLMALALCVPANAENTIQPVTICYAGEVTAVDLHYRVNGYGNVSVSIAEGFSGDWNYVASEHRLYISIASSEKIDLSCPIAEINANDISLTLEQLLVNGQCVDDPIFVHTPQSVPAVPPTCDRPGLSEGSTCEVCGAVLKEQKTIPATGPTLSAVLDGSGKLRIRGAVSDEETIEGRTLIAVYAAGNKMLALCDLGAQKLNAVDLVITDCSTAAKVRLYQLSDIWMPLGAPIDIPVS